MPVSYTHLDIESIVRILHTDMKNLVSQHTVLAETLDKFPGTFRAFTLAVKPVSIITGVRIDRQNAILALQLRHRFVVLEPVGSEEMCIRDSHYQPARKHCPACQTDQNVP